MPTSPYLNTSRAPSGRYRAEIFTHGRRYHLGLWASAEDAARAVAIVRPLLPRPLKMPRPRVGISTTPISSAHSRAIRRRVVERLASYDQPPSHTPDPAETNLQGRFR